MSFGFGGTGKSVTGSDFNHYGRQFGRGDVVTAYIVSKYNFKLTLGS